MGDNNPGKTVSRWRMAVKNINSICIDFSGYKIQPFGGNNCNNLPKRNNPGQLAKSSVDNADKKAKEISVEASPNKKSNQRKNGMDFSLRKYVAEKSRKQSEERGELLPLGPNSSEAPANPSPIQNTTVTTGVADEDQQMEKNTLEDPKTALSLSVKEENPVASDVGKDDSAGKKDWVLRKPRMRRRKQKTRLLSDIYRTTNPIGETDTVAGLVAHDLAPIPPSGQSPSSQGPNIKEEMLPEEPPINMPNFQRRGGAEGTTTTFKVVNVVEDSKLEEEEGSNIRIRRRKHA